MTANSRTLPWIRCWRWSPSRPSSISALTPASTDPPRRSGPGATTAPFPWLPAEPHSAVAGRSQVKCPPAASVDATYTQRDGAVDLRKLELDTALQPDAGQRPSGRLSAHQPLGAGRRSPLQDLGEFDTVLRDMGLTCNGKAGSRRPAGRRSPARPIFTASWTGSLVDPHLAGNFRPRKWPSSCRRLPRSTAGQPQSVRLDSVEATGSYSAARIDILSRPAASRQRRDRPQRELAGSGPPWARAVHPRRQLRAASPPARGPGRHGRSAPVHRPDLPVPAPSMRSFRSTDRSMR